MTCELVYACTPRVYADRSPTIVSECGTEKKLETNEEFVEDCINVLIYEQAFACLRRLRNEDNEYRQKTLVTV